MAGDDFRRFVSQHGPALSRTAFLLQGDHVAAEDLLQETLVKAAANWQRIAAADSPEAYVRTMMLNQLRTWRRPRILAFFSSAELPQRHSTSDESADVVNKVLLQRALTRLGPRQRAVLYLRFYEDLPNREIADRLGCSTGTVKRQVHDAIQRLRALAPELLNSSEIAEAKR